MPMSSALTNDPPSPGRGFTKIQPSSGPPSAGKRKVTFTVAPAGTTFGVADPTSRNPPSSSSATNSAAGSERLLSTVTFQDRAFGGTGPAAGGNGVGTGVGLGKTSGGGGGKAGRGGGDTPGGTYS